MNKIESDEDVTYRITQLNFEVVDSIKGKKDLRQPIYFTERLTNKTSCDAEPPKSAVGETWVVFIDYDEGTEFQRFVRSSEFLSQRFDRHDKYDRSRLASIKKAATQRKQAFFGTLQQPMVGMFSKDGLAQKVELRNENGTKLIGSQVPINNKFLFDDLAEGTYTVRIYTTKKSQFFAPEEKTSEIKSVDEQSFTADFRIVMDAGLVQYENFVLSDVEER